ncbi:unnamed protein product, partial [Rotaria magnacalcarata]
LIYGVILAIFQSKSYAIVNPGKSKRKHNDIVKWIIEQVQISSKQNLKENAIEKHETNIDLKAIIDQICDLLFEGLILPWYKNVSYEQSTFTEAIK